MPFLNAVTFTASILGVTCAKGNHKCMKPHAEILENESVSAISGELALFLFTALASSSWSVFQIPLRASSEVKLKEAPAVNEDVVAQYKTRPLSVRPSLNTPHDRV